MWIGDCQEGSVFIDTNFYYQLLRPLPEYRDDILAFFGRIEEEGIQAFTTVGVFDELAYRILLAEIKDRYGGNPLDLLRGQMREMLQEFYPSVQSVLTQVQSFPNQQILPVVEADLSLMVENLTHVHLLPRDAVYLALMRNHGLERIATDDQDFDGLAGIERVWLANPPVVEETNQ